MRLLRRTGAALVVALVGLALLAGCPAGGGSAVGTWGRQGTAGEPYLSLARNGTLSGSDGCNQLYGRWSSDGDLVSFSDMSSTLMACEDVDAWLSRLASARVDGDRLVVLDSSGAQIGTLERTG
jgi:hypothetical protein